MFVVDWLVELFLKRWFSVLRLFCFCLHLMGVGFAFRFDFGICG